jgi:cyclophilin family peptidyl-prolyl cis-trans isomerase
MHLQRVAIYVVAPCLTFTLYCIVFLCTEETAWLDGKHVVFGQVTKGLEIVRAVEKVGSESGTTKKPVVIADCGQL